MKKYLLAFMGLFMVLDANAAGVVLSDTDASGDVQAESNNYYSGGYVQDILSTDSSDPLFLVADNSFLSDTSVYYMDNTLTLGQYIGYGINRIFVLHANINYQFDFQHEKGNGFSATEFGGTYRMNEGTGPMQIISDALFGVKVGGSSHVRTPGYARSTYYAGLRFGRQFTAVTLAGTVKSTWIFDDARGLSYIDFIPEMYFRFKYDLRAGIGADFRKSTNPYLLPNQEWLNFKLLRQFGNTQYVGHVDYEFEEEEFRFGMDVKILF